MTPMPDPAPNLSESITPVGLSEAISTTQSSTQAFLAIPSDQDDSSRDRDEVRENTMNSSRIKIGQTGPDALVSNMLLGNLPLGGSAWARRGHGS